MGGFFRKKKQADPAAAAGGLPAFRKQLYYGYAYQMLVPQALEGGREFLEACRTHGPKVLQMLWVETIQQLQPHFGVDATPLLMQGVNLRLGIHKLRNGDLVVIELPQPVEMPEAYFLGVLYTPGQDTPQVFSLEKSVDLGRGPGTVLSEWRPGARSNLGDGPPPEVDAFIHALSR